MTAPARRQLLVRFEGRVQGVGFRAFVEREALRRAVDGFVRNRRDGAVEAVFVGDETAIDAIVAACREGPRGSNVQAVYTFDNADNVIRGFRIAPTI